ncbi:CHD1 helical C-terminal domain containing protein 1 [Hemicordylus capensis]|uniref:CHD1 helical C-terminal domain containing protein 1 n=1 Tax=Hemicordylus capensis TaxID=884348 RepID=UPI0023026D4B|nr:CHD1 helical C-terminal domain containing protein 1 [Hemicordylus capensis]
MEFLVSREERGGNWVAGKAMVGEGNARRMLGERNTTRSCQVAKSQLTAGRTSEATSKENLATVMPSGDALVYYADGLPQDTFKICKEFLRPFKKCLRKLNLPTELPKEKRLKCTRNNLIILGDHINMFLQHYCKTWELKHWKKMLWRFVSLFSALDEKQLCKLYRYSKTNQMAKFLKAYYGLDSPSLVALPENSSLLELHSPWALCKDTRVQEKLKRRHLLSAGRDQPGGKVIKKRPCKPSLKIKKERTDRCRSIRKPPDGQASSSITKTQGKALPAVTPEAF